MDMHSVIIFLVILTNDTISSLGATQSPEWQSPWCDQLQHPTTQSRQVEDLGLGDGDDYGIDGDYKYDGGDHEHDDLDEMIAFMVARIEDPEETLFVLAGEFQVRIWNIYNTIS